MRRFIVVLAVVSLFLVMAAPVAIGTPADGNGNKAVDEWAYDDVPVYCDGDVTPDLWLDAVGWIQSKEYKGNGNKHLSLDVYHLDIAYTNSDGDSWVFNNVGPDQYYINEDGDLILTITGRAEINNIGHLVINLTTGELLHQAGRAPFGGEPFAVSIDEYACETLFN